MKTKRTMPSVGRRTGTRLNAAQKKKIKIEKVIAEMQQAVENAPHLKSLADMFTEWLRDESGYDEKTWPILKRALNRERVRTGQRKLFDA